MTLQLIRSDRRYARFLRFSAGYFLLFFGSSHGWDGTGYQRMFSSSREAFLGWSWANYEEWAQSDIAMAINVYGAVMLPLLVYLGSYWLARGSTPPASNLKVAAQLVLLVFEILFGAALVMTVLLNRLGPVVGGVGTLVLLVLLVAPRGGLLSRYHDWLVAPLG